VPTYGVTDTGFSRKPLAVILAEIEADQKATIDPTLDVSAHSVLGQMNGVMARKLSELWELAESVYAAGDPDQAEAAQLDAIAALTGSIRKDAERSTVELTLALDAATTVPAGSVVSVDGNPGARFITLESVTSIGAGDYDVAAEAESPGPIVANAETLTVIETSVGGWNAATNVLDAELGDSTPESDVLFRARREAELAQAGGGTVDGIRADLIALDDVEDAVVRENTSHMFDFQTGLPPHSFEATVQGEGEGLATTIGHSIWSNKPAGIYSHGEEEIEVQDSQGDEQTVRYTPSSLVEIWVGIAATVEVGAGVSGLVLRDAVRAAVHTPERNGYWGLGDDAFRSRVLCAVLNVPGVLDAVVGIGETEVTAGSTGVASVAIGPTQYARLSTEAEDDRFRITLNGSPA